MRHVDVTRRESPCHLDLMMGKDKTTQPFLAACIIMMEKKEGLNSCTCLQGFSPAEAKRLLYLPSVSRKVQAAYRELRFIDKEGQMRQSKRNLEACSGRTNNRTRLGQTKLHRETFSQAVRLISLWLVRTTGQEEDSCYIKVLQVGKTSSTPLQPSEAPYEGGSPTKPVFSRSLGAGT
eukprot:533017-Pelagomonas_calceolata.AAC.2